MATAWAREDAEPAVRAAFARGCAILRAHPVASYLLALCISAAPASIAARLADPLWAAADGGATALLLGLLVGWGMTLNVVLAGAMAALAAGGGSLAAAVRAVLRASPRLLAAAPLIGLATAAGFALLVVPGVLLWTAWAAAGPALVVERRGVLSALRRSRALSRGRAGEVRAFLLAATALGVAASTAVEVAAILWWHGLDALVADAPLPAAPLGYWATTTVAHAVMDAWWGATTAALFLTLRERAEGPPRDRLAKIFA